MKQLWELYSLFAKIGAMMFGGGYAMLPLLQREVVEKHQLATEDEILTYFAVGQCTPGIIAVNTATFVGYKNCGVRGGIAATAGILTPSVIIISIIARVLREFSSIAWVGHAFTGIRIAVVALILQAIVKFYKSGVKDGLGALIFLCAFALSAFWSLSPVIIVIGAMIIGLISGHMREKREGQP